uniref:F-box/LRR-repeat protein 12 n=1 Tax=Rhizophora mucronata TaxID=61149 RepID=A0A2P2PK32_RHIMU
MENPWSDGHISIMNLPDDCLSMIFQCLDSSSDQDSFGLTCHRWLNIQNLSRRSLQFQCSFSFSLLRLSLLSWTSPVINSYHLHRLLTRFQKLEHLSLSGCTELSDSGLTPLLIYGANLCSLHLHCCFGITDSGLFAVAKGCSFLTVISLYRSNVTDVGLETLANGCLDLKHINLSYCTLVSDRGLRALSLACRQLVAIKISNCREVTGSGLSGCSPTLTYVDVESCMLQPEGIVGIVSGGGLNYLNISNATCSILGGGLATIGNGLATKLKILNLRLCRTIGDESIVAIAKGCPLLQELNVALCHEIRILGWESIGMNCHKLEKLHVNRCRNFCDHALQAVREGCKRLMVLYISRNSPLSPTAMELFKFYRCGVEIKEEEIMIIGPDWTL